MAPHERNPICIKDSEHLAELIKVRFDASDARQEASAKFNEEKLEVITKQVTATNGRTRKLEDAHIEQIEINKKLLEFMVFQQKTNDEKDIDAADLEKRLWIVLTLQKNWVAIVTIIISIFAINYSNKVKDDEGTTKHQQSNTSNSVENNSSTDGSTNSIREFDRPYTLFWLY